MAASILLSLLFFLLKFFNKIATLTNT